MYHSVSAVGGPLRDLAVPPKRLAEQLTALTDAGYRLVGLSEAFAARYWGGEFANVTVVLILIAVLMLRPAGLFVRAKERVV